MPLPPVELPGDAASTAPGAALSESRELGRRARAIGALLWASFLAAAAGTMFFFAFIAPDELLGIAANSRERRIVLLIADETITSNTLESEDA